MWQQPILWAGIDAGKLDHHCVLIDAPANGCCPGGYAMTKLR